MLHTKLNEWISPLEASLEMSIRKGCYISPDDIKQARGRLPEGSYISISKRGSVYKRESIRNFTINKQKAKQEKPSTEVVASWLWEFPETVKQLEEEKFFIPNKEDALKLLKEQEANKQKNPKPKKTASKIA